MRKVVNVLLLACCFLLVLQMVAFADKSRKDRNVQIGVLASNIGSGGMFGMYISDMFYLGAEYTSLEYDEYDSDRAERLSLEFTTQIALLRIYPVSDSSLYFQGGYVSRDWVAEGWSYDSNNDGTVRSNEWVKVTLTFPKSASLVGVGGNWIADWGLSFSLGLNVIMGGTPEVDVETGYNADPDDVQREEDRIKEDAEQFETIAMIYLGLGYAF